jgi:selenocysteine lyase/cysteine desulfurase
VVHEACKRYNDWANQAPVYHRGMTERNIETTRRRLAAEFGADPEEIAITRNSSESLQIAQMGLDLKAGDEVLTTEQDYGRMLTTWDQRVRRDKIKLTRVDFPVPTTGEDLIGRLTRAIVPQTKVMHFCHITNQSGQLFPVKQLADIARARGIITIVDGAHAGGHFPYKLSDLGMDYYGISLHKWLLAPMGTGLLYVRRDRIASTWPLQAAPAARDTDIRKFEEVGTQPVGPKAAINEAIAFQQAIGIERKAARLRYLTLRWANELKKEPRIRIHSNLAEGQTWGLAVVSIDGVDSNKLVTHLWDKHRIVITAVGHENPDDPSMTYRGLRVTPNIYTPLEEIDYFVEAMRGVIKSGLPA